MKQFSKRNCANQDVIIPCSTISSPYPACLWFDAFHSSAQIDLLFWQARGTGPPNGTNSSVFWELKHAVRPPRYVVFFENKVVEHPRQICDCDAISHPSVIHLLRRISPGLKIVGEQKNLCDAQTK